jgi:molecular chaperone GrpE
MPQMPPTPNEMHDDMPADTAPPKTAEAAHTWRERAEQAERQRDEYLGLLKTARADYENAHQRNRREREQEKKYAAGPLAKDLLLAFDNLERALATAKETKESGPLAQGVALVHSQLLDALKRHGITQMEVLGQPFDPHLHQGVMQQPSAEHPPGTILQVFEHGFMIHDRVLRPASVVIATAPST